MTKVNLADKFSQISEHWSPRVAGELNGQQVKLAKMLGEFDWHQHAHEDELFLVIDGEIRIEMADEIVELHEGEFFIVPKGIEHKPVADKEAQVLMFEPAATLNTGQFTNERTVSDPKTI